MYAGAIVERARARELYESPRHPYTLGLINSFPPLHGERKELSGIPGSPPDLSDLPAGCSFAPRCPYAFARCHDEAPPLVHEQSTGRGVACWLFEGENPSRVPVELAKGLYLERVQPSLSEVVS